MAIYEWSEIFTSIEGEGPYTGFPTTYVRFTKCNFTCMGFNNPTKKEITNEVLGFDPIEFKTLQDLPPIEIGCDSIYSWDNRFKHMWSRGNEQELAEAILDKVPNHQWGQSNILSLTGGEPTLRGKTIPTLLSLPEFDSLKYLLIETNASVPLRDDFIEGLNHLVERNNLQVIWSNSPKLSVSGEPMKKAINPSVVTKQLEVIGCQQYFKFVCSDDPEHFKEVDQVMDLYMVGGLTDVNQSQIYIMPMACTEEQQREVAENVAHMCINRGYVYCHRVQNTVFGNGIGT